MHWPRRLQTISKMVERRMVERRPFHFLSRDGADLIELPFHICGGTDSALLCVTGNEGSQTRRTISFYTLHCCFQRYSPHVLYRDGSALERAVRIVGWSM